MINSAYNDFKNRFKLLSTKRSDLIINTLSNIFTMRLIGNKTHGDLAEIGIAEFINQFMYDFRSIHVGKDLYRAKQNEEDIEIINELTKEKFPVSLKAYGDGPLQLSTDKENKIFPYLQQNKLDITDKDIINQVFKSTIFQELGLINIMPLIYNESECLCNIMVFNMNKAISDTYRIVYINKNEKFDQNTGLVKEGKGRLHPIYLFLNRNNEYIFEVRYGGATANALQRGVWTHTKNALNYFDSLTNGWINYSHNHTLVKLFSMALNSSENGHKEALSILETDVNKLKLLK